MKTLDTMTSDERNLLLYFETCAVDYGGKIDNRRMNREDIYIAFTGFIYSLLRHYSLTSCPTFFMS